MANEELAMIDGVDGLEGRIFACVRAPAGTTRRGKPIKKICYPRHYGRVPVVAVSTKRKRTLVHKVGARKPSKFNICVKQGMKAAHLKDASPSTIQSTFKKVTKGCARGSSAPKKKTKKGKGKKK